MRHDANEKPLSMRDRRGDPAVLRGDGRTKGRALAAARGLAIREAMTSWRNGLAAKGVTHVDGYLGDLMERLMPFAGVAALMPGVADEMRGLADALALPIDDLYAYQCHDEEFWHAIDRGLLSGARAPDAANRCTALAARSQADGASRVWLAQNLDAGPWNEGREMLLDIDDGGRRALVFTFAGVCGVNGVNGDGLAVCVNTLIQLRPAAFGLPVALVVRGLLAQPDLAAAERFLRSVPHGSGQNYLVADPRGFASFECSSDGVARIDSSAGGRAVGHTNHPLLSQDFAPHWTKLSRTDPATCDSATADSQARLDTLNGLLSGLSPGFGAAEVQAVLAFRSHARHPISREAEPTGPRSAIGRTVASMVFETAPEPRMHLAMGPPSREPFRAYGFAA